MPYVTNSSALIILTPLIDTSCPKPFSPVKPLGGEPLPLS
jgi:hypothetical protein